MKILSRKGNVTLSKINATEYHVTQPDLAGNILILTSKHFRDAVKKFLAIPVIKA